MLTHLSLFSGIGGLDRAAKMAGFETVGQCEFADYPYKDLCKNFPNATKWRDIRTLTGSDFFERTGLRTVDILSGGFPCQPFSVAGKRRGKEDDRYLWPEMLRVISEIQPTWVIGENVAGLVTMAEPIGIPQVESRAVRRNADEDYYDAVSVQQEHMLLDGILKDIENVGYEVQPFVILACGVGAPHRRERLFIVAHTSSGGCNAGGDNRSGRHVQNDRQRDISENKPERDRRFNRFREVGSDAVHSDIVENPSGSGCSKQKILCKQSRRAESVCSGETMADTKSNITGRLPSGEVTQKPRFSIYGKNASNPNGTGLPFAGHESGIKEVSTENRTQLRNWWSVEPNVGRMANGVPSRVDRLKCLGNAVVPFQAYPIFKAIAEIENSLKG
jgi:DNA (cytosine-5)-methyltransferase 1